MGNFRDISWIVTMLIAFYAIGFLAATWLKKSMAGNTNFARCRRCQYPTQGLEGILCPECGNDLADGGILRPGESKLRIDLSLLHFFIILAVTVSGIMLQAVPQRLEKLLPWQANWDISLRVPASGSYDSVQILADDVAVDKRELRHSELKLILHINETTSSTIICNDGGRVLIADADALIGRTFNEGLFEDWLESAGVTIDPENDVVMQAINREGATIGYAIRRPFASEIADLNFQVWQRNKVWKENASGNRMAVLPFGNSRTNHTTERILKERTLRIALIPIVVLTWLIGSVIAWRWMHR